MKIDKDKIVFVGLEEMRKYCGYEEIPWSSSRHAKEYGYGYELFNFKEYNDNFYGYTPPYGNINLKNISSDINSDEFGNYVDNVLVVFTGSRKNKGRIVIGWYCEARIYEKYIETEMEARYCDEIRRYVGYNIICATHNATLIEYSDRSFIIPHAKSNNGVGHGQHNVWYANKSKDLSLKNEAIEYICSYYENNTLNNENKYHENKKSTSTLTQNIRNRKARLDCIKIHGCFCKICEFDFEKTYGECGKDYIEVHHITPIDELSSAEGYEGTNPKDDLIPVCSNCHSMIHRKKVPYTPDEVRKMLNK